MGDVDLDQSTLLFVTSRRRRCIRGRVMRIVNAELLVPTAEEIRNLVQRAYDAGLTRGREEAKRELRGLVEQPAASTTPSDSPTTHDLH
jgi:hypothetical protein